MKDENSALQRYREELDKAKAARAAIKAEKVLAKRVELVDRMRLKFHEKRLRKELSRAARAAFEEQVAKKRVQWLNEVEEEATSWIPEDKIDDVITDDLWATKHPWQYEAWYAHKERKERAKAAAG